ARIKLVAHRRATVVTVGGGVELLDRVAGFVLDRLLALRAQAIDEEAVLPLVVFLVQAELGVEVLRTRVTGGGRETELARTAPAAVVGRALRLHAETGTRRQQRAGHQGLFHPGSDPFVN